MNQRFHELFSYSDGKLLWLVNRGRVSVQAAYAAAAKQNFKEFARV